MLYLAEVQKQKSVFGSGKADFKLLACQRTEQSWQAVPGEELIPAPDDASGYSPGALIMLELSNNRQVQRHYEAGRPIVGILQNFSNQIKKSKAQEEEIEQWKQSLTYQSQELNRREMEMETRREQLEQAEADLEKVDEQRQEVDAARAEIEKLREEFERKSQELEGAWAHLNGEMRRLEERQADLAQSAGLDAEQAQQIQEALNRLTTAVAPTEPVREHLTLSADVLVQQQALMTQHWQQLESGRSALEQQQQQVSNQADSLRNEWEEWHRAEENAINLKTDLKSQQGLLSLKQQQIQALSHQLHDQGNLHQRIYDLLNTSDKVRLSKKVDVAALEAMPIEGLQNLVQELEKDLDKVSRFVNDQEEELGFQQQAIDEVKAKIDQANEFDRLQLETELADEQDRYQMLNETLVGQRRNVLEREEVLSQHKAVLLRRQGLAAEETTLNAIDLEPILNQVDELRQKTTDEMQQLENQVHDIQSTIETLKQQIDQHKTDQTAKKDALKQKESELKSKQDEVAALASQIKLYEELLQPTQDNLNSLKQKLDEMIGLMSQFQEASDYQLQAIADMRQVILSVTGESAELAAS